jgi:L-threonylcarbamoyladenylate synthase
MDITEADLNAAAACLRRGGLVAFPTETVYGLGCDAANVDALRRLYAVKGRPAEHPVIVHVGDERGLDQLVAGGASGVPAPARRLARACWPGPLTVVVRRSASVPDEVTGGRDTVGVRVPDQPVALRLLRAFGGAIAAPSANRFGRVSPTTAADVRADLGGDVDLVLDGGRCRIGVESTIVDCSGPEPAILRLGGVPRERVEEIVGAAVPLRTAGEHAAPGTLPSHYAPRARVELVEAGAAGARATALLASGLRTALLAPDGRLDPATLPKGVVVLSPPRDTDDYAHVLYARLREADARELDVVLAVAPAPDGIGAAVTDRLRRAAATS